MTLVSSAVRTVFFVHFESNQIALAVLKSHH